MHDILKLIYYYIIVCDAKVITLIVILQYIFRILDKFGAGTSSFIIIFIIELYIIKDKIPAPNLFVCYLEVLPYSLRFSNSI